MIATRGVGANASDDRPLTNDRQRLFAGRLRSFLPRVAGLCFVACVAWGLLARTAQGEPGWGHPGEVRVATYSEPHTLNPLLSENAVDEFHNELSFDLLVSADDRGRELPDLAAVVPTRLNGGISKDGLTVTYHLRRNVRWHDGAPFTAHDVAFSFAAVRNMQNNVDGRSDFDDVATVSTPDPLTVVVRLKRSSSPIVSRFFGASDNPIHVVPAHLLERYPDVNAVPFNTNPVGTGPFKFVRWNHGDSVVYEANADYFLGAPKLRRITVRLIPDYNTIANLLRTHDVDLAQMDSSSFQSLLSVPGLAHQVPPLNGYVALTINLHRPLTADLRLREAIAYAIDKQSLIDKNTFGLATPATADLPPESWAHDPRVVSFPYDPKRARVLLDAAGWHLDADGIRRRSGQRLTLEVIEPAGSETARNIDVQVQAMLHDVGIDLEIKQFAFSLLYAPAADGGIMQKGDYDMSLDSWIAGSDPDNSSQFICSSGPPSNGARYCSAAVDAAERAQLSTYDRTARKRAFSIVEQHVAADLPAIWLYWPKLRYVMDPGLHGFSTNCCGYAWNAAHWSR
jgi:peptide/nickel transport system substrate-binding protein